MICINMGDGVIDGERNQVIAETATLVRALLKSGLDEDEVLFGILAGLNYEAVERDTDGTLEIIRDKIQERK